MFDSINWPHSLLKISLHYTSTQISRYLRTHGGLMIKDLLTSSAPRRHGTNEPRPPPGVMQHFLCDAKTVFVPPTAFFVWRSNKTNRSTARTQLLPAPLSDEKYFQHERNPQSMLKTIYQKTLNIVATVGLQDDRMTQYFGWRRSQFYKRSAEANIRTMRTHLRRTSSHDKYLIHTKIFCTLNLLGPIPWSWPWPRAWWPPWARLCSGCPRTRFRSLLFREPAQPDTERSYQRRWKWLNIYET